MYETFEHTADIGLRVRGADAAELFAEGARGLFSLMVRNLGTVRPVREVRFRLKSESIEDLWHDWLAELLFAFHGRRLVLGEFKADVQQAGLCDQQHAGATTDDATAESPVVAVLDATAYGEPIDPSRHEIAMEVKAVTWHQLRVVRDADGWLGEVILDV